ncbi:hypothetical protein TELCIR_12891, partial [Teladorsagia circumcincta]
MSDSGRENGEDEVSIPLRMINEERRDNGDGHRGRDNTEKDEQVHQQRSKEVEAQGPRGFENQSFKVARSSKRAKDMVEHWVNRALDVGVQGLVDEFRSSLSKWQPEGMTTVRPMSEEDSFVRVCRLRLDFQLGGRPATHMVMHYQWENWPDRGVPPTRLTAT